MLIEVSNGEIVDKYTILLIKLSKSTDIKQINNVEREICELEKVLYEIMPEGSEDPYYKNLYEVNKKLWVVEDELREKEKTGDFDGEFINLARSVYKLNDLRAAIKREINMATDSYIVEEKVYA